MILFLCRETFVNTFMLQIGILSNHLNGRDTHVRQIKVYGPQPYVILLLYEWVIQVMFYL